MVPESLRSRLSKVRLVPPPSTKMELSQSRITSLQKGRRSSVGRSTFRAFHQKCLPHLHSAWQWHWKHLTLRSPGMRKHGKARIKIKSPLKSSAQWGRVCRLLSSCQWHWEHVRLPESVCTTFDGFTYRFGCPKAISESGAYHAHLEQERDTTWCRPEASTA